MDRILERRNPWPRRAVIAAVVAALALIAIVALRPTSTKSLAVEGAHITTGTVSRGQFDDIIQVRGRVTPLHTTFVDTASGGTV